MATAQTYTQPFYTPVTGSGLSTKQAGRQAESSSNILTQNLNLQKQALLSGGAPQYFPGQTVAGFTQPQQQAQTGLLNYAQGGAQALAGQGQQAVNQALAFGAGNQQAQIGGNVAQNYQAALQNLLNPAAGNQIQVGAQLPFQLPDPNAALTQLLSGQPNMDIVNQATQAALNQAQQQFDLSINPSIRDKAIAAGGVGSTRQGVAQGVAAGLLGQNVQNVTGNVLAQELARAGQNQAGAASLLTGAGLNQAQLQQQGQIAQGQLGQGQQALNQQGQLNAGNQVGNLLQGGTAQQLQGLQLGLQALPQQQALATAPYQLMNQVGAQQQALNQAQLSADQQRFDFGQMAPYQQLQLLTGAQQAPAYGPQAIPQPSSTQQAILGGLGGLGAGAALTQAGVLAAGSPWIAGLGALGALGGLFG